MKELDSADSMRADDDDTVADVPASDSEDDSYESEPRADAAVATDYMPVKRIVSDIEQLKDQELQQSENSSSPVVQVKTVPSTVYSIPLHLTAYAYDLGDISSFPVPKKDDTNKLGGMADSY